MNPGLYSRWTDPKVVDEFAEREPDDRLRELLEETSNPADLEVLDLGCAGGRNAVLLANHGCSVYAVDLSPAMVGETRRRLAQVLGENAAATRVRQSSMDDLSSFVDAQFDLVVALGIYPQAHSLEEWHRGVAETARVLRPGGRLLVAHFAPGTDLTGEHGRPVPGETDLYEISPDHAVVALAGDRLDALMAENDLRPDTPTKTVERPIEGGGRRVKINAMYRKGSRRMTSA